MLLKFQYVPLPDMLLQQFQHRNPAVLHNAFIRQAGDETPHHAGWVLMGCAYFPLRQFLLPENSTAPAAGKIVDLLSRAGSQISLLTTGEPTVAGRDGRF